MIEIKIDVVQYLKEGLYNRIITLRACFIQIEACLKLCDTPQEIVKGVVIDIDQMLESLISHFGKSYVYVLLSNWDGIFDGSIREESMCARTGRISQ